MADLLRILLDVISFIWPLRIVWQWEMGAYYIIGRYWRDVKPGLYPVVPWFMDVRTEGFVSQTFVTPLQTITTKDGGTLTFSASMKLRVVSLGKAYNNVLQWSETAMEDASSALSEKLMDVEVNRLESAGRGRLLASCKQMLSQELEEYGLAIDEIRFNNFVRNMKVYRLFNDQAYRNND